MNVVSASVDWLFCWHVWGSWYQWSSAASFSTGCGDGDGYSIFIWHQVGVDMFRFMVSKLSECWAFPFWSSGDSWTGASGTQDSMVVVWGRSILDHTSSCCFGSGSSSKDPFFLFHGLCLNDAMCSFAWPHSSYSLWICSWHLLSPCFERLSAVYWKVVVYSFIASWCTLLKFCASCKEKELIVLLRCLTIITFVECKQSTACFCVFFTCWFAWTW